MLSDKTQVDSTNKLAFSIETTKGDSAIHLPGNYIFSSFDLYDTDTEIKDSIESGDAKIIITVGANQAGKREVKYKSFILPKTIIPSFTKTKVQYDNVTATHTQNDHIKVTIEKSDKKVNNNMNSLALIIFFISVGLFIIFLIYKFFKK